MISCTKGIRVDPPTKTISSISNLSVLKSLRTFLIGLINFSNKLEFNSSNFAREIILEN